MPSLGSLIGKWKRNPFLTLSAERSVYAVWFLITLASGVLVYALMTGDFRLAFVAQHTDVPCRRSTSSPRGGADRKARCCSGPGFCPPMPPWWSGRTGKRFRDMMPYVVSVLMATLAFFLILIGFVLSPFDVLMQGKGIVDVGDGNGLNPLLQYPAMVIHPPILYLGYVGFVVPFAFAIASLITKQPGDDWIHTTRRWSLVTWLFQTTRRHCSALAWAYAVLGWGGYWGWDPVENASLLPWITATAFLHSVMMQEKKGMMKVWNMVLVSATFFLCIFGTFLTRSGVVQFGPRLRAVVDRNVLRGLPDHRHRGHRLPDPRPPEVSARANRTWRASSRASRASCSTT